MIRRRFLALTGAAAVAAAGGAARWGYHRLLGSARTRSTSGSTVISTRAGAMEYAEAGEGPPVLMIHGTGGGFDRGLAFGHPLTLAGWRVVAPSRIGRPRPEFPEDASCEAQAGAFVDLLDYPGTGRGAMARSTT